MASLTEQRCANHPEREAAARCPGCSRFLCRECVTEHGDRVLCAACIAHQVAAAAGGKKRFRGWGTALAGIVSFLFLWWAWYLVGRALLGIPSSFHDGTVWKELTGILSD